MDTPDVGPSMIARGARDRGWRTFGVRSSGCNKCISKESATYATSIARLWQELYPTAPTTVAVVLPRL